MAAQVEIGVDELYRLSLDDYHRLIEAGAFEDFPRCELIDGLLVRKEMKTREHENAVAWLTRWLVVGVDPDRFEVRVGASLTLERSEPEPDLSVIPRAAPRPYHPASAALIVEVSVTSLRHDLRRKPGLYARAGIGEYWVLDVAGGRIVVHRAPGADGYAEVREVPAGGQITDAPAGVPALDVDELLRAAAG